MKNKKIFLNLKTDRFTVRKRGEKISVGKRKKYWLPASETNSYT